MSAFRKQCIYFSTVLLGLLCLPPPVLSGTIMAEQTLSADRVIAESFQPGSGLPVGKVQSVRGETLLYHRDPTVGYRAEAGLPLYQGDTVSTPQAGRILCQLVDGSRVFLSAASSLKILQCNYNAARQAGVSFLFLQRGGARFQVRAPVGVSAYAFKVQTETAFIETHAADFVVQSRAQATEVMTLTGSQLEITGMADPEEVTALSDFQRTVVASQPRPPAIEALSQPEVAAIKAAFQLYPPATDQTP